MLRKIIFTYKYNSCRVHTLVISAAQQIKNQTCIEDALLLYKNLNSPDHYAVNALIGLAKRLGDTQKILFLVDDATNRHITTSTTAQELLKICVQHKNKDAVEKIWRIVLDNDLVSQISLY
jgi:hypothetical protein